MLDTTGCDARRNEDVGSNCHTEGLPGQQARTEGEDAYSEESGESEDDLAADGEVRVTV